VAALWTEVCLALPVLCALAEGYEVYIVTDASGGVSQEAHQMAIQRMIQAGATPVTWMQVALELQRDWSRKETYDGVLSIIKDHGGAYGQGVAYVESMLADKDKADEGGTPPNGASQSASRVVVTTS
jgi:nicotinamidase-related amidase